MPTLDDMAEQAFAAGALALTAPDPGLHGALLESRQRWRDFAILSTDFAFETDAVGRLVFVAPEVALGWPAETLLGRAGRDLLASPGPDPFTLHSPARGVCAWLRRGDGGTACLSFAVAPLIDAEGRFAGLRGCARDITAEAAEADAQAAAVRRSEALQTVVQRVRRQVLAPQMLAATLESLQTALGCTGAAVLEVAPDGAARAVHRHGADPTALLPLVAPLAGGTAPAFLDGPGGESLALLPHTLRLVPQPALLAWRAAGLRGFDADDRHMLVALSDLVFVTLGNQALQHALERLAQTDALTGLFNRRAFLEDLGRRLDRQAREPVRGRRPDGALIFLDLDNLKPINDQQGHEAGDAALIAVAGLLRDMIRPTDVAARLGGDEFAIWLQGADAKAAGARAAALCAAAPTLGHRLPPGTPRLTFSIGCAIHLPGAPEPPERLLARADAAMYEAKRAGRDRWVVAEPPGNPPGAAP